MILTKELWDEYTEGKEDYASFEELKDEHLFYQACAAANAVDWKLKQMSESYAKLARKSFMQGLEIQYAVSLLKKVVKLKKDDDQEKCVQEIMKFFERYEDNG
jgi:hypothetical protein